MKKIYLTEQQLYKIVSLIVEKNENLDTEDYKDIYYRTLRKYVEEKYDIELPKNVSINFLIKKFQDQFIEEIGFDNRRTWSKPSPVELGRHLIQNDFVDVPDLSPETKFTEKYKKPLEQIISLLRLPETIKLMIEEPKINKLSLDFIIPNFNEYLKTPSDEKKLHSYYSKFTTLLEKFLGIEWGRPEEGYLQIGSKDTKITDYDNWLKTDFNKKIKPYLREKIGNDKLKSITLDVSELLKGEITIKLIIKDKEKYSYWRNDKARKELNELISNTKEQFYNDFGFDKEKVKFVDNIFN